MTQFDETLASINTAKLREGYFGVQRDLRHAQEDLADLREQLAAMTRERDEWRTKAESGGTDDGVQTARAYSGGGVRTSLQLRTQLAAAQREGDAYKKAKAENDERFMRERDEAREESVKDTEIIQSLTNLAQEKSAELRALRARFAAAQQMAWADGYADATRARSLAPNWVAIHAEAARRYPAPSASAPEGKHCGCWADRSPNEPCVCPTPAPEPPQEVVVPDDIIVRVGTLNHRDGFAELELYARISRAEAATIVAMARAQEGK